MNGTTRLLGAGLVLAVAATTAQAQPTTPEGRVADEIPRLVAEIRQQGIAVEQGAEFDHLPTAIQALQGHGQAAVAPLGDLLHDGSPWVRWQAAWCLAELAASGIDITQALPSLMACGEQARPTTLHFPCVTALGNSGDQRALPVLRAALHSPSREVVLAAIKALRKVGLGEAGLPDELRAAARRLQEAGQQSGLGLEQIEHFLERVVMLDVDTRPHAADTANGLADAVERMLMLSHGTRNLQVRFAMLRAVFEIDSPHAEIAVAVQALSVVDEPDLSELAAALPELFRPEAAEPAQEIIRRWCTGMIAAARDGDTVALHWLIAVSGIASRDAVVLPALDTLAAMGPAAVTAVLEELAAASQPAIRRNLILVLGRLARHLRSDDSLSAHLLEEVVPVLEELLTDQDQPIREAAAAALANIRPEE